MSNNIVEKESETNFARPSLISALTIHDTSQCIHKVMPFDKVDIDKRNSIFRLILKLSINTLLQPIATLHQYTKTKNVGKFSHAHGMYQILISVVLIFQVFFLTIAKKNRTKMARVIEAAKISPIGGSSKIPIVSSRDSKIS